MPGILIRGGGGVWTQRQTHTERRQYEEIQVRHHREEEDTRDLFNKS